MSAEALSWTEDYGLVTGFGKSLVEDQDFDAEELQAYYEKPWKFTPEFYAWQKETA